MTLHWCPVAFFGGGSRRTLSLESAEHPEKDGINPRTVFVSPVSFFFLPDFFFKLGPALFFVFAVFVFVLAGSFFFLHPDEFSF